MSSTHFSYIRRNFFLTLLISLSNQILGSQELVLNLATPYASLCSSIEEAFSQPFHVERVTFDADVYVDPDEFYYLTDLHDAMDITAAHIKRAINHLIKKKKFQTITLRLLEEEGNKKLHISLIGIWTFGALKFHGMM